MAEPSGHGAAVFISVDLEGVGGVSTLEQTIRGRSGYPAAQELMELEASAVVEGARRAGAGRVVVADAHGTMDNLRAQRLPEGTELVAGRPRPGVMMAGMTDDMAVALFVGYHAAAGEAGVLAHTLSSFFAGVWVNGQLASEAFVNGLWAGELGVPVGLVSGDDATCERARREFPGVVTVQVKRSLG